MNVNWLKIVPKSFIEIRTNLDEDGPLQDPECYCPHNQTGRVVPVNSPAYFGTIVTQTLYQHEASGPDNKLFRMLEEGNNLCGFQHTTDLQLLQILPNIISPDHNLPALEHM